LSDPTIFNCGLKKSIDLIQSGWSEC